MRFFALKNIKSKVRSWAFLILFYCFLKFHKGIDLINFDLR